MTSPTIIFDHVNNVVAVSGTDPKANEKLAAALDAQRHAVTTVGGAPAGK